MGTPNLGNLRTADRAPTHLLRADESTLTVLWEEG